MMFALLFVSGCHKNKTDEDILHMFVDGNGISHVVIETKLSFKDNLPCVQYIGNYIYLDPDFLVYNGTEEVKLSTIPAGTRISVDARDSVIEELPYYHFEKVYKIKLV